MNADRKGNWFVGWPVIVPPGWIDLIRAGAPAGMRWFAERDLHLTLAFLGRFQPDRLDAVTAFLGAIAAPPDVVTLGSLRLLPNSRRISAVSFELESGRTEVCDLIARHRAGVSLAAGVATDGRPALAHITIARPERRATIPERREIARWAAAAAPRETAVRLAPPAIFAWSKDRSTSLFEIVATAPGAANNGGLAASFFVLRTR
jgi:2'-5' RNA ligase